MNFAERVHTPLGPGILTALLIAPLAALHAAEIYVAPNGNNANHGTKAEPFATPKRARDEIRAKRKAGGGADGPWVVCLRGGTYRITQTVELAAEDSGSENAPLIWQAMPGEEVRFMGGVQVPGLKPVVDPSVVSRLDASARGKVVQADLRALGVKELGEADPQSGRSAHLFCNGRYLTLARYPNDGDWLRIAGIPEGGTRHARSENDEGTHYGRFSYESDRPARWKDVSDLWVFGYWLRDYSGQHHRVQKLDVEKKEIWPQPPYHWAGYGKGQRFYCLNVLEELDQPGEWYLDRKAGIVYLWPPCDPAQAEVSFPEFEKPMLVLNNTHHVSVRGIVFECSRSGAVEVKAGTRNEIVGCTVRNVAGVAIKIDGGTRHTVRSCDVCEVGSTGISLSGGDRKTLGRGDHVVDNCHIHHYARIHKTLRNAVTLYGVGHRISHCKIHDAPHQGIHYYGNDHVIEFCDFTRICQETGDAGVIYTGADWTFLGHEIRYNYFHGIHAPGAYGCYMVYPDLPCGGIHLHGNIFSDVDGVFLTNSGRGNVIENNLFVRCSGPIFSPWKDPKQFQEGGSWGTVKKLKDVNYDQPPYSTRYPVLQRLAGDFANSGENLI